MILVINTAREKANLSIYDEKLICESNWETGKTLSGDLIYKLDELFRNAGVNVKDLTGIIVYSGPGSFTGLRIGISTANILAYAMNIPIVGVSGDKDANELLTQGKKLLESAGHKFTVSLVPFYGAEPSVTISKK